MSARKEPNRHYLLCDVCKKTQAGLSVHLRKTCLKNATKEEINRAVECAKTKAHDILVSGIIFDYHQLTDILRNVDPIQRLVEELESRNMVVRNAPPKKTAPAAAEKMTEAQSQPDHTEQEDTRSEASSGETFQCYPQVDWKKKNRQLMAEKGLYRKHSIDHPILSGFATHLHQDRGLENYQQVVENVARFLYYMDPSEPTLQFVKDKEKAKQYLRELTEAQLTRQTQVNYLKSVKSFLKYHAHETNLGINDPDHFRLVEMYINFLDLQQKNCSKQVGKEVTKRRHDLLTTNESLTPSNCLAVLRAAKKDFLAIMAKCFIEEPQLEASECCIVLYYLEAIVILQNLQRPGVVENMTAQEWVTRKREKDGVVVIGVKEHKTAAHQLATFGLSEEEELWFDIYFNKIRPQMLNMRRGKSEEEEPNTFFISTSGRPIFNASNDLNRLHKKYNVQPVTSQQARRVFETSVKTSSEADKTLVADYLTHSNATAEKHYRMKESINVVKAKQLLAAIAADSGGDSDTSPNPVLEQPASSSAETDMQSAFSKLLQSHPVTLDGQVPGKEERIAISHTLQRKLYERWLKEQMKMRAQHILSYFGRRLPKEHQVASRIEAQGWKSNIPKASYIVRDWKPPGNSKDVLYSNKIQKYIRNQKWSGLAIKEFDGKGRGVVTTRPFHAGEVVCDYHGRRVSAAEGNQIHKKTPPAQTGYMFFYKSRGISKCIDAHEEHCDCHPERLTFGRFLNHSKKRANLKPQLLFMEQEGEENDVILFIAAKDLKVGEELAYHYGVDKNSFGQEGCDIDWFDE